MIPVSAQPPSLKLEVKTPKIETTELPIPEAQEGMISKEGQFTETKGTQGLKQAGEMQLPESPEGQRIVPDEMSELSQNLMGVTSPLARAILDEKVGILIPFFTEEIMAVQVLEIRPGETDLKSHRIKPKKLTQDEIKAQIAFREAQLFASSGNTKWGSYDPDGWDQDSWNVPKEPIDPYINEEDTRIHEEPNESLED